MEKGALNALKQFISNMEPYKEHWRLRTALSGAVRPPAARLCLALLASAASGLSPFQVARAQSQAPAIVAEAVVHVAPDAATPLRMSLSNENALPPDAILVFRGLSPGMRLSEGRQFGSGVWVAPTSSASKLLVYAPSSAPKETTITIGLTTLDGENLSSARIALIVLPATAEQKTSFVSGNIGSEGGVGKPPTQPAPISPADRGTAEKLMKRAEDYMKSGSVIVARQLFQGAAERGLAEAAFALAQTYDQRELAKLKNVVGVAPDPALAKKWYARADELGMSGTNGR